MPGRIALVNSEVSYASHALPIHHITCSWKESYHCRCLISSASQQANKGGRNSTQGEAFIQFVFQSLPASEPQLQKIKTGQKNDEVCKQITTYCSTGWPHKSKLSQSINLYHPMAAEFTVANGLLMRGNRIVISSSMRSEMLEKLH